MATRPCKPGADMKRIWQWLLPEMPFPACGTPEKAGADEPKPPQGETATPRADAPVRPD